MCVEGKLCVFRLALSGVIMLAIVGEVRAQTCQTQTYTSDTDFNEGYSINIDRGSEDRLQVNAAPVPAPYIWVANSRRGTIARIRTDATDPNGAVLGEYWSAPESRAKNPSRTSVALDGSAWAGNRDESWDGKGSVVKIGLVVGGSPTTSNGWPCLAPPFDYCTCVDRDGDGLIRTSTGLADIFPWPDGSDGEGGIDEAPESLLPQRNLLRIRRTSHLGPPGHQPRVSTRGPG